MREEIRGPQCPGIFFSIPKLLDGFSRVRNDSDSASIIFYPHLPDTRSKNAMAVLSAALHFNATGRRDRAPPRRSASAIVGAPLAAPHKAFALGHRSAGANLRRAPRAPSASAEPPKRGESTSISGPVKTSEEQESSNKDVVW